MTTDLIAKRALSDIFGQPLTDDPVIPASFPLGRAWYVVATLSRSEFEVERELQDLGFEAYTPRSTRFKIVAKRKFKVAAPLFTGYVFVHADLERERQEWNGIAEIEGVIGVLKTCDVPRQVKDIELDRLRRMEAAGVFDYTKHSSSFECGQVVDIMEGPLSGWAARFKASSGKKRATLELELFNRIVSADIDPQFLARAG